MQLDINEVTLKTLAEKLVFRLNQLGIVNAAGRSLVVDQGYEAVAALLGFRNQHALRAALAKCETPAVQPAMKQPYQDNMAQWGADSESASELVYGILRANEESLSEFTSETMVGSIVGFVTRARLGLDLVEPQGILSANKTANAARSFPEDRKQRLRQFGYDVTLSDFKRPYWQWGGHGSEDFETEDQAWFAAWAHADENGYLNVLPERAAWVAFVARLESQWVTEHPWYTQEQWRQDVENRDTSSGYWEYVAGEIESHGGECAHDRAGMPLDYLAEGLVDDFDFRKVYGETIEVAARNGWDRLERDGIAECAVFLADTAKPNEPTRKVRFIVSIVDGQAVARVEG